MKPLVISLLIILAVGCRFSPTRYKIVGTEKIENVTRVFMNDPGRHYTLLIPGPNPAERIEKELYLQEVLNSEGLEIPAVMYKVDVPPDKNMWAILTVWRNVEFHEDNPWRVFTLELHIHEESEIEGGGWIRREGKIIRRGNTVVIR